MVERLEPQEVLGENVTKFLSDKMYDNRKKAAIEIESAVKTALARGASGGTSQVQRILACLRRDYVENPSSNNRKGGLIGLAAVAIGLDSEVQPFLSQLVHPVLELFKDDDSRVRYYACEALYNISKVAGEAVLAHFNDVFDGLCKLYADVDTDVKNGANVLDRLMKDVVTHYPAKFRADVFVQVLGERMKFRNPYIRQLVLAWITLLLKVPEVDMVKYLPEYLEGLIGMLADQSKDIRHNADNCLHDLRKVVTSCPHKKALETISKSLKIIVMFCTHEDDCTRLTALCWLYDFVKLQIDTTQQMSGRPADTWVGILPDLLGSTLHCIDDQQDEIARLAVEMNNGLLEMVQTLQEDIPVARLVDQLLASMQQRDSMVVRTACLQWICMLLGQPKSQMRQRSTLDRLFRPIFDTLLHPDDEVVVAALTVLAQIMEGRTPETDEVSEEGEDLFTEVTHRLLRLFAKERQMLENRGRLMMRQLCGHLDPRRLYITVARAIHQETDLEFAQQLVKTFSWILLTSPETKVLREELLTTAPLTEFPAAAPSASAGAGGAAASSTAPAEDVTALASSQQMPLFLELLEPWFHNPVSALALCLWAQQYELATELTARLAAFEPTLDLLRQLDQLVHLLESPVFSRLRLRLLEPRRHPALLKCLLGLAMLLPQAGAFSILRERLHVVQSGLLLEARNEQYAVAASAPPESGGRLEEGQGNQGMLWWPAGRKSGSQAPADASTRGTDLKSLLERFDSVTEASHA